MDLINLWIIIYFQLNLSTMYDLIRNVRIQRIVWAVVGCRDRMVFGFTTTSAILASSIFNLPFIIDTTCRTSPYYSQKIKGIASLERLLEII